MDLNELLQQAELVFEGEVIASQSQWNADRTSISTLIQFRITDIIKGEYDNDILELQFAGGTVDDMTLQIADMHYPEVSDKGIYFVEQLNHTQINPLLGWNQGHFRIIKDSAGEERMYSAKHAPIQSLQAASRNIRQTASEQFTPFSEGTAAGLRAGTPNTSMDSGMNKNNFKDELRSRLQSIRADNVQ